MVDVIVDGNVKETVANVQRHMLEGGPCYIAGKTTRNWGTFPAQGKVWKGEDDSLGHMGHAMIVVGWGKDGSTPYWLIRNSYGPFWGEGGYVRIQQGTDYQGFESSEIMCPLMTPSWEDHSAPVCRIVSKELSGDSLTVRVGCWENAKVNLVITGATNSMAGYACLSKDADVLAATEINEAEAFTFNLGTLGETSHCPKPTSDVPHIFSILTATDSDNNEATRYNMFRVHT